MKAKKPPKICSNVGCDDPVHARGLCRHHYAVARYRGELEMRPKKGRATHCTVCGKPEVIARGRCWAHYQAWRRNESPAAELKVPRCTAARLHVWTPAGVCLGCRYDRTTNALAVREECHAP